MTGAPGSKVINSNPHIIVITFHQVGQYLRNDHQFYFYGDDLLLRMMCYMYIFIYKECCIRIRIYSNIVILVSCFALLFRINLLTLIFLHSTGINIKCSKLVHLGNEERLMPTTYPKGNQNGKMRKLDVGQQIARSCFYPKLSNFFWCLDILTVIPTRNTLLDTDIVASISPSSELIHYTSFTMQVSYVILNNKHYMRKILSDDKRF